MKWKSAMDKRHDKIENNIRQLFGLSADEYVNVWYELGCLYAERLLKRDGHTGIYHKRLVREYIISEEYWGYWAKQWTNTCEWYIYWTYGKKRFSDFEKMQLQANRPNRKLYLKIINNGTNCNRQKKIGA